MASTTVRISSDDKKELDELISFLSFKAKRKLTQTEILSLLISIGKEERVNLVDKIVEESDINYDVENDPFFNLPEFDMDEDTSENIDKIIYNR